jgi:hypothetical protein
VFFVRFVVTPDIAAVPATTRWLTVPLEVPLLLSAAPHENFIAVHADKIDVLESKLRVHRRSSKGSAP